MFKLEARTKYQGESLAFGVVISDSYWVCPPQRPSWRITAAFGWWQLALTIYRLSEQQWAKVLKDYGIA